MKLDSSQWQVVNALLDAALDVEDTRREAWLAARDDVDPVLRGIVAEVLTARAAARTADFIDMLPPLEADDALTVTQAPGDEVGPYRLLRKLGAGGMGEVWLAQRTDGLIDRLVAIKLPTLALSRAALAERFARERSLLATLAHDHIARLYDAGFAADGQPYLALEYVEGEPIDAYADRLGLGVDARLQLFAQVLEAVAHAHANLVLHRDLKPSNILVTPAGKVKLLDFGIAKLMDAGATHETVLTRLAGGALTPDYASPEQIAGAPLSTASDVYALGVVLFELLCGERPYKLKRGTRGELEEAIAHADAVAPSQVRFDAERARKRGTTPARLRARLAGDLDTIVGKALRKDPLARYTTVDALAEDLRRHAQRRPVLARPDSRWYRTRRFVRRNAVPVAAGSVVAVALVAATAVSLLMLHRADDAAAQARQEASVARAVSTFMTDLFRANSLDQNFEKPTRDLTASQLLDRGAMSIDTGLDDAPAAKAAMLKLFGEMYEELGLAEAALRMHEKSVAEAERVFGRDSREYALALLEKAWVTNLVDRRSRAPLDMTREAKAILAARAPGSEDYGEALYMESHMLQMTDANAAVAAGEESLRVMQGAGATGKRLAFARMELGGAYRAQGDLTKAAATMRAAIADYERLFGPEYAELGYLNSTLATVLQLQLRLPEAEARYRRAIASYDKYPSHRPRGSAVYRTQLAILLHQRGKHAEGYAVIAEAEAARKDAHDAFGYTVEQVRVNRGGDRLSEGDVDRGIAEIVAAYGSNRAAFPPRSITPPAAVEEYLARGYLQKGDVAEAAAAAARAQEHATRDGVPAARAVWIALSNAEARALQGHADEALGMIDQAVARNRLAADNPASALQIALSRARIAQAAQRPDDALAALAPWLDRPLAEGEELPRDMQGEMLLLAGQALAARDPAKARERLIAAREIFAANDVEGSPRRARVERALAELRS